MASKNQKHTPAAHLLSMHVSNSGSFEGNKMTKMPLKCFETEKHFGCGAFTSQPPISIHYKGTKIKKSPAALFQGQFLQPSNPPQMGPHFQNRCYGPVADLEPVHAKWMFQTLYIRCIHQLCLYIII